MTSKITSTFFIAFVVLLNFSAQAFNVTFRVDMSQQTDFTTPEVNGSFNSWCGNCFQMTDANGDNIWEATTDLAPGNYEYKFSADGWGSQETLLQGSSCTVTNFGFTNRTLVVTGDVVLPVVCWGACVDCAAAPVFYDVTFQVDMSEQNGFTTPEVNGSFNGWCGNCTAMSDANGDGIWSVTVTLQEGTYEYKFSHDNWTGQEALAPGSSCTVTTDVFTNRTITVSQDEVLPAVCYGSCAVCGINTGPYDVTFSLDMNNADFPFTTPEVNGTFNNWCGNCAPMSDSDGDNIWTLTVSLQEGSYDYKFSHDNWLGQETLIAGLPCTSTLEGFTNRTIDVTGPTNIGVVCWESCSACIQQPVFFNVDFQVDMQNVANVSSVEVNGTFNNWCGNCFTLSDPDGDNIWNGTTQLEAGVYEYKFSHNGGQLFEQLTAGDPCTITNGEFTNRSLEVGGDVSLPAVCWESCLSCGTVLSQYNVTFQVDMQNVTDFTVPEVNGSFNGWCGGCFALTDDDGDGIWTGTAAIDEGIHEYKFAHDSWLGQENLLPGLPCTVTNFGFTNRSLNVTGDIVLPVVCWGSCLDCASAPVTHEVTFQVDMNGVVGFTTPEVNGTFNNWCGNCFPMSDANGDGIWQATTTIQEGSHEFKFSFDNWAGAEQLTSGDPCTVGNGAFVNRSLNIESDTILAPVCWASCNPCNVSVLNQMNLPVTFDNAQVEYGLLGFDGSEDAAIVVDPTDASNMVARVTKSSSAGASSGVTITAPAQLGFSSPVPFTADATAMSVRVWSPDAGIQVRLKVEDHTNPTQSVETNVTTSVANDWETLVFDFANQSAGTAALNLGYTYDKASIFFNFGVNGATAGEKTYYFDDVVFGGEVVVATQYNVTFQVDMQNVTDFTVPEVNGTFNNWCGGCFALTDTDGDGIWTGTAAIDEGIHEYKFAHDAWLGQENLLPGLPCTVTNFGFTNRSLNVTGDVVLPVVCWASCVDCSVAPVTHEVTFQVDMNGVVGFTTPEVNGTFNNWCGSCFPMSDTNGDGIWEATTTLQEGIHEFKFSHDNWTGSEQLTSGDPCTVTNGNFVNRSLNIASDTILAPVCWGLCGPCTMPEPVSITLNLDLGDAVATSAEVTGSFNNYCVGCQPMTSLGNNQYSLTFEEMPGVHYYQFTINGGAQIENLAEGTCTVSFEFGIARELVVSEDVNVGMVCWESCAPCLVNVDEMNPTEFVVSPNPANTQCMIQFSQGSMASYQLMDAVGRVVLNGSTNGAKQMVLSTEQLPAGLYQLVVSNASRQFTQKIIVQH